MRRLTVAVAVMVSAATVAAATIGSVGAGASGPGRAPDKTFGVSTTTQGAPPPTPAPSAGPTSVAPSLAPVTFAPPVTTIGPVPTGATTVTTATTATTLSNGAPTKFDPVAFFGLVFSTMATSPQALVDIAATYTVAGSPANWFLQYLTGVASALAANGDQPIPTYSVQPSADGLGLDVCQVPGGPCDVLADFVEVDGLLASFTIDGTDITGRFGSTPQPLVVAGLEFGNVIAFQRLSTDSLAIVLSLTGGDQQVQIEWAQAVYMNPDGTSIPLTSGSASVPDSLAPNAVGMADVIFPGALIGGRLDVPVNSGNLPATMMAELPILPAA